MRSAETTGEEAPPSGPVRSGCRNAIEAGPTVALEIGPHPVLATDLRQLLGRDDTSGSVLASIERGKDSREVALASLGALYEQPGFGLDHARRCSHRAPFGPPTDVRMAPDHGTGWREHAPACPQPEGGGAGAGWLRHARAKVRFAQRFRRKVPRSQSGAAAPPRAVSGPN